MYLYTIISTFRNVFKNNYFQSTQGEKYRDVLKKNREILVTVKPEIAK